MGKISTRVSKSTVIRLLLSFVLMLACFAPDWETLLVLKYVAGFQMAVCFLTHITRKLLFPYVDLADWMDTAKATPLSAAIVVASVCAVICCSLLIAALTFQK